MIEPWITFVVAIVYLSILFAVASFGDRSAVSVTDMARSKPNTYALSLAVYCTTWTFFGSVGLAATSGLSFLAIYVGPILVITIGFPLMKRIITLSKQERITSVADFLGARYGKSLIVAAVAAIIAVIGTVPYIALQLKAISGSVGALVIEFSNGFPSGAGPSSDITLMIAGMLAVFAILFGTRHADATEHQSGMMLAIALESVIKLVAFLSVGIFVTWFMFDGIADLYESAVKNPQANQIINNGFDPGNFAILTILSLSVFLLLPRQFHVAVVENRSPKELERARWLFPLYLVAINIFVIPIAIAGTLKFGITANADDYVLLLPILEGQRALGLLVFIGGLSAGTAMVVVASVALAIMISNDLVLPLILRSRARLGHRDPDNMERSILNIRRTAIFGVLLLAYLYYLVADNTAALASIGLVSFAAIAQLAPAFFGGLFWKRANARGAMAGMITGFTVWLYCLLLPTLFSDFNSFVSNGPLGNGMLKPQDLFNLGISPIANGVIWSLLFNTLAFIVGSRSRVANPQERVQASLFSARQSSASRSQNIGRSNIQISELKETLARYIGRQRTERSFETYWQQLNEDPPKFGNVDNRLLRFSEQTLASSIGASSSRLVHTLLLKRHEHESDESIELLDEASRALQFNRDVLQTAFDQLEHGITVFDGEFRLASWNRQFRTILNLEEHTGRVGLPINQVVRDIVECNTITEFGPDGGTLVQRLITLAEPWQLLLPDGNQVIEIRTSSMPEGGIVVAWHNITERVRAAEALREANETLEGRVEARTRELEEAKQFADQANASKTRFLAAAGHDILQPLNAARLFSATLTERIEHSENKALANNISRSLGSVEEILGSILAISRLDAAKPEINITNFPLRTVTEQLELEFEPIAKQEGLDLVFVHSSKWVRSDRALLRRLLQNLISNGLKFTKSGKVLVGFRTRQGKLCLEVYDTGIGMTQEQQKLAFAEFTRLNDMVDQTPGLGLGLSIVDRISTLLSHPVQIISEPDVGTWFSIQLNEVDGAERTPQISLAPNTKRPGQLTGTQVLCIDNEATILEGMEALLVQWGCDVKIAGNSEEAIAQLQAFDHQPNMVLVDYHLDETTGIDLFKVLCEEAKRPLNGALITADRSEAVKLAAGAAGINLINKPVRPAMLRALLSQHRQGREAAE